ncbi:MAG: hypothetical protein ACYDA0_16000 [Candidatus Dormibacteraceae bacterium]
MAGIADKKSPGERKVSPPSGWVALRRAALAKAKGHPVMHFPKGHLVMVIPELTNSWRATVDVRTKGKVLRVSLPTDAIDPAWQKALRRTEVVTRRMPILAEMDDGPSIGRLGELLPELAAWVAAALAEAGESEASLHVERMDIRACWRGALDNYNLSPLPRDGRTLIFGDPDRKAVHLLRPKGLPRRRWSVGVQIIRGRVMEIGVARPTVLRPTLDRLERTVKRLTEAGPEPSG